MSFQNHPAIPKYLSNLDALKSRGYVTESQTRGAFQRLLEDICADEGFLFVPELPVGPRQNRKIDGAVQDTYSSLGYWEAKDAKDDLETEIKRKIAFGYPLSNTIFEDTRQAILWQNSKEVARFDLRQPAEIAELLDRFFGHTEADARGFADAVKIFIAKIPELAGALSQPSRTNAIMSVLGRRSLHFLWFVRMRSIRKSRKARSRRCWCSIFSPCGFSRRFSTTKSGFKITSSRVNSVR
ncbi:hypothetical protein B1R32_1224 [Abditibacterium utsteinense]|uniref:Uncharacterized protein n=1 Tax=Abditibacterium utsteinense TaxID=1960156 RepID=A0A2S8SPN0_9BACT|nr:hypothetical protein [Abditibacterium utsteinense]PQV62757.1 hypothetical protein B1R32_1224 [Abditibacterium utsteinense]